VPATRCWVESSVTAVVNVSPGISTMIEAIRTERTFSGTNDDAISDAKNMARNAATASNEGAKFDRRSATRASRPISRPMLPAASTSAELPLSKAATVAPAMPKLSTCKPTPFTDKPVRSARSSANPSVMPICCASTRSAMASTSHRRRRFTSPGFTRITIVLRGKASSPSSGSTKDSVIDVGVDRLVGSRPRRALTPSMARSRRGADVPY
jgi:hypothetical protein